MNTHFRRQYNRNLFLGFVMIAMALGVSYFVARDANPLAGPEAVAYSQEDVR